MNKMLIITVLFFLSGFSSGAVSDEDVNRMNENLDKAHKVSSELLGTLKESLLLSLKEGGPEKAVPVCSKIAPAIAKNISENEKLIVRRVSLRTRNAKNAPDEYEKGILRHFERLQKNNRLSPDYEIHEEVVENNKRKFRYMKPILVTQLCLNCHGKPAKINPKVLKVIKQYYHYDKAVNYNIGDVRGAVSVIIPDDRY